MGPNGPFPFIFYISYNRKGDEDMKDYHLSTFLIDLILGGITGGLWWIYRLIRVILSVGKN